MTEYYTRTYVNNDCTATNISFTPFNPDCTVTNISSATTITIRIKEDKINKVAFNNRPIKVIGNRAKPFIKKKEIQRVILKRIG